MTNYEYYKSPINNDVQTLIDRLPDAHNSMAFVVKKRICKSIKNMQFLTSGFPNRSKDKKTFNSVDGIYMPDLLPGLKANEADYTYSDRKKPDPRQGIEVCVHISRVKQEGWTQMYVFGFNRESRLLTPYMPENVRKYKYGTKAKVRHGSMYISTWCDRDYFPNMEDGEIFPVYVKVTRKEILA